jgi:beta-fructofuranosidase
MTIKTSILFLSLPGVLACTVFCADTGEPRDLESKVPKFVFADTLEEQEKQLQDNGLIKRFAESRKENLKNPYHPRYHFVSPEDGLMNDPTGLSFWQGRWHVFYNVWPPEDKRVHWGHAVSDDLVRWRALPYAIYPNPERDCYSGGVMVDDDKAVVMYPGMGGNGGIMVAVSSDPLLLNWKKVTGGPVIPHGIPGADGKPIGTYDPCIWKKDGMYYGLTSEGPGGYPRGVPFKREWWLHRSEDLAKWEYLHPFVENDRYAVVGDDSACPYFWPIGDRHILLHFSHRSGAKYLLGDYDKTRDKFVASYGGDFNFGPARHGGLHAPSATPDGKGGVVVIFNMNAGKACNPWNSLMTVPRRLTLIGPDELGIEPVEGLESLRGEHVHVGPMDLPANEEIVLEGVQGNTMELVAEIDPADAPMVELLVLRSPDKEEYTRIVFQRQSGYPNRHSTRRLDLPNRPSENLLTIDNTRSSILPDVPSRMAEIAPLALDDKEPLTLRVFIDRSVLEVFANGRQALAVRVYPGREDSLGVSLRAQGKPARLNSLDAWQMKSIYE